MPFDFDVDIDELAEKEGGKGLRQKLEAALQEGRRLQGVATSAEATRVIGEKGYDLVSADDLKGVALDEIEVKAAELQEQKSAARADVVKSILAGKGLAGDELDQAVEEFLGSPAPDEQGGFGNVIEAARADGKPAPAVDPTKLHGTAAIEYGLAQQAKRKK